MKYFVTQESIVRRIWGRRETILFIFAGAAAEFALNKAVDWLYFTGRLPADPIGRLFSTVNYARMIVFSPEEKAFSVIDKMRDIHLALEKNRNSKIPGWAYRDVLYMLIHYSIVSHELLYNTLTSAEKDEVYQVFRRLGLRMELKDLPVSYAEWQVSRQHHLNHDLERSHYTDDLFVQYRKHLGNLRYFILLRAQALVVPDEVNALLRLPVSTLFKFLISVYKVSRKVALDWFLISWLLPSQYKQQIFELNESRN